MNQLFKIAVDCSVISSYRGGIHHYFLPILKRMVEALHDVEFSLVVSGDLLDDIFSQPPYNRRVTILKCPVRQFKKGFVTDVFHALCSLPVALRRTGADYLISPYFNFVIPGCFINRSIFMVHDTCQWDLPHLYPGRWRLIYSWIIKKNVRRCSGLITVSEYSKKRIAELFFSKSSADKIHVVPNSLSCEWFEKTVSDNGFGIESVRRQMLPNVRYVLYSGGVEARKNIDMLICLMNDVLSKDATLGFVLTGGSWLSAQRFLESIDKNVKGRIVITGYVNDTVIRWLNFRGCAWGLTLSLDEGFGRSCLEAVFGGLPFLCSGIPIFREVAGEYPLYCNPNDYQNIRSSFWKLVQEKRKTAAVDYRYSEQAAAGNYLQIVAGYVERLRKRQQKNNDG